jgi:hypothetical protein
MRPRVRRRLNAAMRPGSVDTSAPSQFEPSFGRKIGSRPAVVANRTRTDCGVTVHP